MKPNTYKKSWVYLFRLCLISLLINCISATANAGTDKADLTVGMKTLPLLTNKISGNTKLAIIYDPTDKASSIEAENIVSIMDSDFVVPGDITLHAVLIPISEIEKIDGSKIAVLTSGLGKYYKKIGDAASRNKVLTMSTDIECARAGMCILGIISKPKVEIFFNKQAADTAGIQFGQVFSMLVKQI